MPKTPKTLHHTPPTHHHKATTIPTTLKTRHRKTTTCPNTLKTHHHKTTKTHHNKTTTIPTTLKTHHHKSTTILTTLDSHNHKTSKTGNHEPTQKMPAKTHHKTTSMPTTPLKRRYPDSCIGDCNLVHSLGPYGENIAKSSRDLSATAAVNMLVSDKSSYDYNSNSCAPGKVCGHYTQVVWRNSVRLGCAKARCNNGTTFIGCNYDPPGNYDGRRPY
ncbi:hypothetical protein CerSpe_275510 [Prunus speciosa]